MLHVPRNTNRRKWENQQLNENIVPLPAENADSGVPCRINDELTLFRFAGNRLRRVVLAAGRLESPKLTASAQPGR